MDEGRRTSRGSPLQLNILKEFPASLLDVPASELVHHLPGPTLFELDGRNGPPLFVTVLLHGNEDTGWRAAQTLLRRHQGKPLPRPLLLFVGNLEAAEANFRTLPNQTDYNRTWPGTLYPQAPEAALMRDVVETVRRAKPFASIDIHNNTGNNPNYACLNSLDDSFCHLARLFSRTVVYFRKPEGVQSAALAEICPSVTIECGRPGGASGVEAAANFIDAALALSHFPNHPVPEGDLDLMQTFAIVKVPKDVTYSFDGSESDLMLRSDLDRLNFSELATDTLFGTLGGEGGRRLEVLVADDAPAMERYFSYESGEIRLSQPAIPAMLTLDRNAVRLDCLGYLMHRIGRDGHRLPD
jgi:uncharacterized protein